MSRDTVKENEDKLKDKAKESLLELHRRSENSIKVFYREGNRKLVYETTMARLDRLVKRLSKTGEVKVEKHDTGREIQAEIN